MIITADNNYSGLDDWLADKKKVFLVCDASLDFPDGVGRKLEEVTIPVIRFSDFKPNPLYESVVSGVRSFREHDCDCIMAVGGGSALDVAKCIRVYSALPGDGEDGAWLEMGSEQSKVPFLAMPTTAGTGSEATRYAVIYYNGLKQSITGDALIPETVIMDPDVLKSLPVYQRKATMCDALMHAVESFWSVNSNEESREYSREAIGKILANMDGYLMDQETCRREMLYASNLAGRAINITQTTAGHAMCYKITSLYGCAHGHSAILCDRVLFPWMLEHMEKCTDPRGTEFVRGIFDEIALAMGVTSAKEAADKLEEIFEKLNLSVPEATSEQLEELKHSVNTVRLKNHPFALDAGDLEELYRRILRVEGQKI